MYKSVDIVHMNLNLNRILLILFCTLVVNTNVFATPAGIGFEVLIIKPDDTPLEAPSVDFKFKITDPLGTCVIYVEDLVAQDMTGSQGQKSFIIGNPGLQTYPDPMVTPLTIAQVFSNSSRTFACQSGGSYTSASIDKRQLLLEFNDGSGAQVLSAVDINSVPFALEAASVSGMPTCGANQSISFNGSSFTCVAAVSSVTSGNSYLSVATTTTTPVLTLNVGTAANTVAAGNDIRFTDTRTPTDNSVTSLKILDGAVTSADISVSSIQSSHLSQMGASLGQVMKWDGSSWVASSDNSGSGSLVTSVAGRTGAVTLSSSDITGLAFGTTIGTFAQGNDSRFTDQRNPINDSVTSAKILDGTIAAADLSSMDASAGQVIKWNGSAWIASNDNTGGGGSVTSVSASGPLSSTGGSTPIISIVKANGTTDGYLSSSDFTTFSNKLSDFSSLLSSDITSKLGYIPLNPATAVTSVAGRTGVVTLSSSDITGLAFGATAGTYAQGDDSRFTDQRNPINDSVTSAKILDGTIAAADLSSMDASAGQVIKWNGSAWIASNDNTGGGGSVTSVSASGPLSSTGGSTPIISIVKANGTTDGYLSSSDFTTFSNKLSDFSSLLSSDITGKLGYTPVNPSTLGTAALLNTNQVVLVSNLPGNCNAGQTLTFSSPTGSWLCSNIVLGSSTVTSAMISSVDWTKVVNTPTTAAGYGIAKATAGVDGYLSSADFTIFNSKLSDFSTLSSSDINTAMGYTALNSSDISGKMNKSGDTMTGALVNNTNSASTALAVTQSGAGYAASFMGGNVGIGNASPFYTLDVTGNFHVNGTAAFENSTNTTSASTFSFWKHRNFATVQNNDELGFISFSGHDGTSLYRSAYLASYVDGVPNSGTHTVPGRLGFFTTPSGSSDSVERIRVTSSGNVGIGTTNPLYALEVSGDISVSGNFKINGTNISAGTVTSVTSAATPFNPILVGGSGSAPTLDIPQATTSVNGYLSSSDFTTFSNKLSNFSTLLSSDITTKLGYTPVNPSGSLKMTGQIASGSQVIVGGTTSLDWNSGNIISTDYDCTSDIAFANLVDGGTYTLIVTSTGTAQCNFSTTTTGVGAGTVSYRYKPANAARTSSSHSIYTLMRSGSNVYISWTSGF